VRACARRDEQGFGLLELVVASTVMMTAITSLAYVATDAFGTIGMTRERSTANGLLDEALEQLRALPYSTIALGMETANLAGDPRVIGAGTALSPYRLATTNERIVHVSNNVNVAPLVPNSSTRTVNGIVFTVRVYLSYFQDNPASGAYTGTAYVDWFSGLQGSSKTAFVRASTIIFSPPPSPSACLSTTTHAFSGPCMPFFTGVASVKGGRTLIATGATTGAVIDTPGVATSSQIEQISRVQGWATTEALGMPSGTPNVWGPLSGNSQADNDPASPGSSSYEIVTGSSAPPSSTPTTPFGSAVLNVTVGGATSFESVSTTAAGANNPAAPGGVNTCRDLGGTAIADSLPCSRTTGASGTMTSSVDLTSLGGGLGSMDVVEQGATTVGVHTNRDTAPGGGRCAGTSNTGCISSSATRTISSLKIGGVPSALKPAGFGSLIELTGYTDTATAAAGIGALDAQASSSAVNFRFWNGAGYSLVPWASAVGTTVSSSLSVTTGVVTINITSNVRVGNVTALSSPAATCMGSLALACRTHAEATLASPLRGTVSYDVRVLGVSVLAFTVSVDMGDLSASAAYEDPPTP
jgi:hypothetical protein